jgi:predicted transcriptional regulator
MPRPDDELAFLLRSDNRTEILAALCEAGPLDRYELESRVDASRRTVTRIVGALTERGYLAERDGGYVATAFGSAIADAYDDYRRTADLADAYRPVLGHLDSDRLPVDPELLRGAELTLASETSPYALLDRVLQLRSSATTIREMAPSVEAKSVAQLAERVGSEPALDVEVILPASAIEEAASHPEYAEAHAATRESDAVELYAYPEPFGFMLGRLGETGALAVGVDGRPHALVESTDPEFLSWIEDRLAEFRGEATPVTD